MTNLEGRSPAMAHSLGMLWFFLFIIWFWLLIAIFSLPVRDHEVSGVKEGALDYPADRPPVP